ncbi:MAG: 1-deoxy-D-xylulose-5-phosphate reductoisomerase [Bacteroidota bacterium]|nr:1-deoxy-D-xylulose-5-phosphate reductoisomerase [Bacteroidota bacterium]
MQEKDSNKRHIAILGSTGSIGTQALDVIAANKDKFEVEVLSAQNNAELLIQQAIAFQPNVVVIVNEDKYEQVKSALSSHPIKVYTGSKSLCSVVEMGPIDIVLTAMVGYSGLLPTIHAIKAKKTIALANKETLVVAGALITKLAYENGVNLLPVDSEHSAIFQCLLGEFHNPIEKVILTASGGPFRGKDRDFLSKVTKEQALKHPNWSMGAKITIDSSTLMNKGLEVIEAKWLFAVKPEQIDVIVHPQSIVHSLVQFADGSIKAQMGLPDMKLPIQFALGYPNRLKSDFKRFDFMDFPNLTFEKPDLQNFECLNLAFEALKKGGNMACILNAANEVAVAAFLQDKIKFLQIAEIVGKAMQKVAFVDNPGLDDYIQSDVDARKYSESLLS